MSGLSKDQRAALWQIQTGGKNNPYNAAIGNKIKVAKEAEKEANKNNTEKDSGKYMFDFSTGKRR